MAREGNIQLFPKGPKYYEHFDQIRWDHRPDEKPDLAEVSREREKPRKEESNDTKN